jgi:hypothetical protein
MSLTSNNNQKGKAGKGSKNAPQNNSKFINKPTKAAGVAKKPVRTGGTRGS